MLQCKMVAMVILRPSLSSGHIMPNVAKQESSVVHTPQLTFHELEVNSQAALLLAFDYGFFLSIQTMFTCEK